MTAVVTAWATNTPPNYMVVSLMTPKSVQFYTDVELIPYGVSNDMYKTEYLVMRKIPAGNVMWRKGSPSDEIGRKTDEATYQVTLSDDFYLGVYPVTQRQYQLMTGLRPSAFSLDSAYATRPVEQVSYESLRGTAGDGYDWPNDKHKVVSTGFIHLLRAHSGLNGFDLPTAAQWEFACRAGCGSAIYNGKNLDDKDRAANLVGVARYKFTGGYLDDGATAPTAAQRKTLDTSAGTNKVGSYEPNAFGLYDMLGNTFEWCLDWYASSVSGTNPETGPLSGEKRELKSGDWQDPANFCRAASRMSFAPNGAAAGFGFRMACSVGLQ